MKRVAYIAGWAFLPLEMLKGRELTLMGQLTIYPKSYGDDDARPIKCYSTEVPGYLGLPIDWALEKFPHIGFEDRTTEGGECYYNRLPDPNHPRAAPGQAEFMADLDAAVANYHTVLAKAATGSGKTVTFLRTAALNGRRTLILVHLERLARQWAREINDKLGVPFDDIGWVQGDICTWDKPFVVGLTNSVADRVYPKDFYTAFGLMGVDEGHRLGAPLFSQVIGKFPSRCKVLLTATDKRKDGCDKVFHFYYGLPKVRAAQPAMRAVVHSMEVHSYIPQWMTMPSQIASALAKSEDRNRLIIRVAGKLYANGRTALFIGDSTQHLQDLMALCRQRGIPEKDLGLYVDQKYTGQFRKRYSKVKAAARGDSYVYWKPMDDSDVHYPQGTPVTVTEVIGGGHCKVRQTGFRIPLHPENEVHVSELRKRPDEVPVMEKVGQEELNRIEVEARLIFATYGMLKEGIDIPRLDAGMDVSPRADGEQVIGRIRRPLPGKPEPIWYSLRDIGHPIVEKMYYARIRDYRSCNCVVLEHGKI